MILRDVIDKIGKVPAMEDIILPFFEYITKEANDVPISIIKMAIPASGFATEDGVYLNEDFYNFITGSGARTNPEQVESAPFQIIHEIMHYRQFQKEGRALYEGLDGSWDDFITTIIRVESDADEKAAIEIRKINTEAGIPTERGIRIQKFGRKFEQFMYVIYTLYNQNKSTYDNFGSFQTAMASGAIQFPQQRSPF